MHGKKVYKPVDVDGRRSRKTGMPMYRRRQTLTSGMRQMDLTCLQYQTHQA
jgi:hypothetical protein